MAYKNSKAQAALGVGLLIGPQASAYTGNISVTGTTTSGSASITAISPGITGISAGMPISGTGIPVGATVLTATGTTLTISANATATGTTVALTVSPFIRIGECSAGPVSGQQWDEEDVTNFDSIQPYKEQIKTLLDSGKLDIEFNRVSTDPGQAALQAAFINKAPFQFMIQLPMNVDQVTTGDSSTFAANVVGYEDTSVLQVGKVIKGKASLHRTGAIAYVEGA